ncbi:MAG: hypothetical protein ABSC17_09405 [Thermacetogeniaceae bacterium]
MISLTRILVYLVLIGISFYTASYGFWTWNQKNRLGAAMVLLVALAVLALPLYAFYAQR